MSVAALVRKMVDAGATPEVIAIAVEAVEALAEVERLRKAKRAEQKRHERDNAATVARQSLDKAPTVASELPLSAPPRDINSTPSPNPIAKNTRGSRLPDDWRPSQAGGMFAAEALCGIERSSAELLKFRDYWRAKPGAAGVKLDWEATWRNWVRSAAERGPRGGPPPKTDQRFNALIDLQKEANRDRDSLDPEKLYLQFSGDQART